jgi:hypothetical protein
MVGAKPEAGKEQALSPAVHRVFGEQVTCYLLPFYLG